MKVYNQNKYLLSDDLKAILNKKREEKSFMVKEYVKNKINILNDYISECGLNSCIVGVSGGIDSAIVLSLVKKASKQQNSNITNIIAVYSPVKNEGMSNQDLSYKNALSICNHLGIKLNVIDLTKVNKKLDKLTRKTLDLETNAWAKGQLVSYSRTPLMYYISTLENVKGNKSIICGTTNKDEGAFIGFIGKASDAMVDIQLISDIHKSEVYEVAKYLDVPKSIIKTLPSGDMFDGRTDEEVFGTSYDFIELYFYYLQNNKLINDLSKNELEEFKKHEENVLKLHNYNKHKYLACSQAVHLDIIDSKVKNGWCYNTYKEVNKNFINQKILPNKVLKSFEVKSEYLKNNTIQNGEVVEIYNLLNIKEFNEIKNFIKEEKWLEVGYDGILKNYKENDETGSYRLSIYSEEIAKILWERIKHINLDINVDAIENPDLGHHKNWKAIGINPLFRFIKYKKNNLLVNHYDSPYIFDNNTRTLKSMVIYLTTNTEGKTRFFNDEQLNKNLSERSYEDSKTCGNIKDLKFSIQPKENKCVIFNHNLLHDSEPLTNDKEKIIIRTDIIYEKN